MLSSQAIPKIMISLGWLKSIFKIYLFSIIIFLIFRIILLITEIDRIKASESATPANIAMAFVYGFRFDLVVISYIMFIPTLLLIIRDWFHLEKYIRRSFLKWFIFIMLSLVFMISGADIPFFNQFFQRFNIGAFEWIENPTFVFGMIVKEPRYFAIALPVIVFIILMIKYLTMVFKENQIMEIKNKILKAIISLVVMVLVFYGMRGRFENKSPIREGTAYFCEDPFLNQLGLNPSFTFANSYIESLIPDNQTINYMTESQANSIVQRWLKISKADKGSPVARFEEVDSINNQPPNVVLIIMESMSAENLSRHGNKYHITPFLDSIANKSLYFSNIYSAGMHTFNGIFGTLFSFPAIFRQHSMKKIQYYNGMPQTLKQLGYSTMFFATHDTQFDNMEGFLRANGFDNIIGQTYYPSNEIKSTLGVPDHVMFNYSIDYINKTAKNPKPFLATLLTTSNHGPYIVPDFFKPKNTRDRLAIIEYSDWALKNFMEMAKKQAWYDNTVFVFVADHGISTTTRYEISLTYHHTPLIVFDPSGKIKAGEINKIGGQIDLFPTLMGLLNLPFLNNTLGINLMKQARPYILINADDKFGVLDTEHILILNKNGDRKFYNHRLNDPTNILSTFEDKANEMQLFGEANLQVMQNMINKGKTKINQAK